MPYDVIRRMLRAAIESFPIDEEKKEELLQKIMGQIKKDR